MKFTPQFIMLLTCSAVAWGQVNTQLAEIKSIATSLEEEISGAGGQAEPDTAEAEPDTPSTHIFSDTVELEIKSRSAVYRGNVRLEDPRIYLTCEQLTAEVPEEGGRVDRVVAETNVVILMVDEEGNTNRAHADKAVYTYQVTDSGTNEVVELTGDPDPHIETSEADLYGNPIVWDRTRNQVMARNQRMIYRAASTNLTGILPQTKTNSSPVAEHSSTNSDFRVNDDPVATETVPDE